MGRAKKQLEKKKKKAEKLKAQTASGSATVAQNRKARHDFHLGKEIIAGIVLEGSEVKSLRLGLVQMRGAYAKFIDSELWLLNCHISEYKYANQFNHNPDRAKKLLLKRYELSRLELELQKTQQTLVASKIFFRKNKAKVILHLAEGKKSYDKREDLKRRQLDRDVARILA